MKHLITKLLLLVMVGVLGIPINGYATDLYLTGNANSMESKDVQDWSLSKKVSSDSSDEAYFWVEGEFAVSSSNSTDWTTFNNSRIKFENNKLDWNKHDNSNIGASSSNRLFVKVTFEMGNDRYTTSTTPFSGHEGVWGSSSNEFEPYVIGFINSGSWQGEDSSNAVKMEKQSDGTWKANNVYFQKESGKSVSYFHFYDKGAKQEYGPETGGTTVSYTSSNSNTKTNASWSVAEGYYDIVFTESDKSFTIVKHGTSVTYTYYIHFGDDMTANAASDLQLTAGTDVKKSDINGQKFRVYSKPDTGDIVWYGSNNSLNQSGQTQVNLSANGSAITLPSKDGEFTFNLSLSGTTPQSIMVTAPETTFDFTVYVDVSKILEYNFKNDNKTNDWSKSVYAQYSDFGLGGTATKALENVGGNIWKLELKNVTKVGDVIFTCYSSVPDDNDSNRKYGRTYSWNDLLDGHKYSLKLNGSDWFFSKDDDGVYINYSYYLRFQGADGGHEDVEFTDNFLSLIQAQLVSNKIQVVVKSPEGDERVFGKTTTLESSASVTLAEGNYWTTFRNTEEGFYAFTLTLNNEGLPKTLQVTIPTQNAYTVYVDVTEAVTKNPAWGSDNYGKYTGFGCADCDKVALTKVDDNVWRLVIPGATQSGKVKFFCGSNLGTGAYESSLEFGDVKDGNYYRLMTIPGQTYFDVSIYQRFPARIGKYYLVGDVINNYYPSPAWEMKQEGDGDTYILQPFAMRNCNVAVAIYGEDGIPRIVTPSEIVDMPAKVEGGDFQPGVLCTARYDAKSNKLDIHTRGQ